MEIGGTKMEDDTITMALLMTVPTKKLFERMYELMVEEDLSSNELTFNFKDVTFKITAELNEEE